MCNIYSIDHLQVCLTFCGFHQDKIIVFFNRIVSNHYPSPVQIGQQHMNAPLWPFLGPELQGKTSYRVHDLLLDFARTRLCARDTLTDVQRLFVKILRGQCVDGGWTITSSIYQKDYYFKYLPYHLHSSEQHDELLALFLDFHWLEQKLKQTNVPSIISDFRFLTTPLDEMKLLKSSLMFSADIIEKNPDSIGPQLLGNINTVSYLTLFCLTLLHFCLTLPCLTLPCLNCLALPYLTHG